MKLKSKIKQISPLSYDKELIITEIRADPKVVEDHRRRLQSLLKDKSPQEIDRRLESILIRDCVFNEAMEEIVRNFKFEFDQAEIDFYAQQFLKNFGDKSLDYLKAVAEKVIIKSLVFDELAKEWNIVITDEEVKDALNKFYAFSNTSIKEYLEDKEKFENIRDLLKEERIANLLIKKFKHKIDLKDWVEKQKAKK